jgi:membrane-bound lytic murein transglycosylase D
MAKNKHVEPALERYVVKFGESLDQVAQAKHVPVTKLVELNAIAPGEVLRGGTVLLVPKGDAPIVEKPKGDKPVAIVPRDAYVYPDRKHVFYKVQIGDTIKDVASAFKVTQDELRRWNDVDPSARLVEGMTLQVFAPRDADLSKVAVLGEQDVRTIVVGTDEFFRYWDDKGRHRTTVTAKAGDTLESIGKKNGVSAGLMERINRKGRNEPLAEGDTVVLWLPSSQVATGPSAQASLGHSVEPEVTPPLAAPPAPDRLPALP